MATSNRSGPNSAANPLQGRSRDGRSAPSLDPAGRALRDLGDEATTLRNTAARLRRQDGIDPPDSATCARWLDGSADRLDSIGRSLAAAAAPQDTVAPPALVAPAGGERFVPDAERRLLALECAWQLDGSLDLLIESATLTAADELGALSVAIRCKALACAAMSALDDEDADLDDVHRTVRGTPRARQGVAS